MASRYWALWIFGMALPFGLAADDRTSTSPIESVVGQSISPGDVMALARQYIDRFSLPALYVADLDAIEQRTPQHSVTLEQSTSNRRAGVA